MATRDTDRAVRAPPWMLKLARAQISDLIQTRTVPTLPPLRSAGARGYGRRESSLLGARGQARGGTTARPGRDDSKMRSRKAALVGLALVGLLIAATDALPKPRRSPAALRRGGSAVAEASPAAVAPQNPLPNVNETATAHARRPRGRRRDESSGTRGGRRARRRFRRRVAAPPRGATWDSPWRVVARSSAAASRRRRRPELSPTSRPERASASDRTHQQQPHTSAATAHARRRGPRPRR